LGEVGDTMLIKAAKEGEVAKVKRLIAIDPDPVHLNMTVRVL